MALSINDSLQAIGLEVSDLVGLTEDEIKEKLQPYFTESSDVESLEADLLEVIETIEEELAELEAGLRADYDDAEDAGNSSEMYSIEYDLEKLSELEDVLRNLDNIVEDLAYDEMAHKEFITQESDGDLYFSYDSTDLDAIRDGDEVTLTATGAGGTGSSVFADSTDETEVEGDDVNGDGFVTFDDYKESIQGEYYEQEIFIDLNSGDQIELVSFDESSFTAEFQVTTSDGKTFTITTSGKANLQFTFGGDNITQSQVAEWPEALQKICYESGDSENFFIKLYEQTVSEDEMLGYVETYDDVVSEDSFNNVWSMYSSYNTSNTDKGSIKNSSTAYTYYEEAMNDIYAWINDTSSSKDSISEVWADILQGWSSAGLNDNDYSTLISMMVLAVGMNGNQNMFQTIFGSVVATLEGYMINSESDNAEDSLNTLEKMAITFMESQMGVEGAGQYGGSNIWSYAYAQESTDSEGETTYIAGEFTDHESNTEALDLLTSFYGYSSWATSTGYEQSAKTNEENIQEVEAEEAEAEENQESAYIDAGLSYLKSVAPQNDINVTENELVEFISLLSGKIQNGKSPYQALQELLEDGKGVNWEGEDCDDLATSLVSMLYKMINSGDSEYEEFADWFLSSSGVKSYLMSVMERKGGSWNKINDDEEIYWEFLVNY